MAILLCSWITSDALALGAFITDGGTTVTASRSVLVLHDDEAQLITQVRYEGNPSPMVWLVAVPNVNNPIDNGVRAGFLGQSPLDLLDDLTHPSFRGACNMEPNGEMGAARPAIPFGPSNSDGLPATIFSAPEIEAGELAEYVTGLGLTIDETTQTTIDEAYNQNYMFVAVRIDAAALGVARVDPIVSIRYPADTSGDVKLAIRPLETVAGAGPVDITLWVLGNGRAQSNLRTETVDFASVAFAADGVTNYLDAFDEQVGLRQTTMFMVEYAGDYDEWGTQAGDVDGAEALEALVTESGSRFLTRLRARISPAGIRTRAAFTTLSIGGAESYSRDHEIEGSNCGAPANDAGMNPPVPDSDMGMPDETDAGDPFSAPDGSMTPAASGGGDSGGCRVGIGSDASPVVFFLLLFLFPFARRRLAP